MTDKSNLIILLLLFIGLMNCEMEERNDLNVLYTLGIWTVNPGMENQFINEWTSFAQWTGENIRGSGKGYLLRDEKDPLRFISFGPWEDEVTVQKWRSSAEFQAFAAKAKDLCSGFQPHTMKVVATSK